jgi:hypothetical protein
MHVGESANTHGILDAQQQQSKPGTAQWTPWRAQYQAPLGALMCTFIAKIGGPDQSHLCSVRSSAHLHNCEAQQGPLNGGSQIDGAWRLRRIHAGLDPAQTRRVGRGSDFTWRKLHRCGTTFVDLGNRTQTKRRLYFHGGMCLASMGSVSRVRVRYRATPPTLASAYLV